MPNPNLRLDGWSNFAISFFCTSQHPALTDCCCHLWGLVTHQAPPQGCSLLQGATQRKMIMGASTSQSKVWRWLKKAAHAQDKGFVQGHPLYPIIFLCISVSSALLCPVGIRGELYCVLGPCLDPSEGKKTPISVLLWRDLQGSPPYPKADQ